MINLLVFDENNQLKTEIDHIVSISFNPAFDVIFVAGLSLNKELSYVSIHLKDGDYINVMEG